ncbi:fatty acid synthase alpha subunit Lsd1 [Blastocladiella emersonii ATCC 22665]|nr:fatty acid synthase alpha subunit Lsd1 [Blastocladiella emersonii ATCC 22665]
MGSPERSTAGAPSARDHDSYDYSNTYGMHSGTHLGRELEKGYDSVIVSNLGFAVVAAANNSTIGMNDGIDCELITIYETTTTYGTNESTGTQQWQPRDFSSLASIIDPTPARLSYTYTDGLGCISTTAPSHVRVDRDEVKLKENRGRGRITQQLDDIADSTFNRWIDPLYGSLLINALLRIEERFMLASASKSVAAATKVNSILNPLRVKADPTAAVADFLAAFPRANTQLLLTEDVFFLLTSFVGPNNSLWKPKFVEAAVGEDAQRVCILQGPVATRHANVANLPVKQILDTVRDGHIAAVLDRFYNGDLVAVPRPEYLANFGLPGRPSSANVLVSFSGPKRVFEPPTDATKLSAAANWLAPLGRMFADNYVPRLLAPRPGISVTVTPTEPALTLHDPIELALTLHDPIELALTLHDARTPGLVIRHGAGDEITMTLTRAYNDHAASLDLILYAALWATEVISGEARKCPSSHVDRDSIARFCKVVQNDAEQFVDQDCLVAPLNYAVVAG